MRAIPINDDTYTEEELLKMPKSEAIEGLTEKQRKFCEYFAEGHNRKMAMIKAGYSNNKYPPTLAYRLLQNPDAKRYVQWLKAKALNKCMINAVDVLDAWIRIAFSDITDFVDIYPNSIRLKPAAEVDGQLVKSIKSGRDGISIELHDKMKALDSLSRYIEDMPHDWREKLERRKLELQEQEFELKKRLYDIENPDAQDDGFIEAIKNSIPAVWGDEDDD